MKKLCVTNSHRNCDTHVFIEITVVNIWSCFSPRNLVEFFGRLRRYACECEQALVYDGFTARSHDVSLSKRK